METESDPFELHDFKNEWIQQIEDNCSCDRMSARYNIKKEQQTQKKIFDRKVQRSR